MAQRAERKSILKAVKESMKGWQLTLMRVKKPTREEFKQNLKAVVLGLVIVGVIAYIIHLTAFILLGT